MEIKFTLNNKQEVIDINGETRLIDYLRDIKKIKTAKPSCYLGRCGNCAVLLDDKLVNSCSILMFSIRDKHVTTGEGFIDNPYCNIILSAFKNIGFAPCDFCKWGKIFAIYDFFKQSIPETDENIINALKGNRCNCCDYSTMIRAVKEALLRMKEHN